MLIKLQVSISHADEVSLGKYTSRGYFDLCVLKTDCARRNTKEKTRDIIF